MDSARATETRNAECEFRMKKTRAGRRIGSPSGSRSTFCIRILRSEFLRPDRAMKMLLERLQKFPSNDAFLKSF